MDAIRNPYTPGAGTRPAELAGRSQEIDHFKTLVGRLKAGRPDQSQIIRGLRGVGKTVLLNTFEDHAESEGFITVFRELTQGSDLLELLAKDVDRILRQLSLGKKMSAGIRDALSRLDAFTLTDPSGYQLSLKVGKAAEDVLADDLTQIFLQMGGAARAKGRGVIFFFDEVQFIGETEFRALIAALHRATQKELPLSIAAAGLPQIPRLAGEARSYAERLFTFPEIGPLSSDDAAAALVVPARREGVDYEDSAVQQALELTAGYPFYLQEFGKHIWNVADVSPITAADVETAAPLAEHALDRSIYDVRIQRATAKERRYLRAMAELGRGPYKVGSVASKMGTSTTALSTLRKSLLDKGLIYATEDYGYVDFTVPRFDEFMRRYMDLPTPARRTRPTRGPKRPKR